MGKKSFQADQLIPTSSTPPPEAGFYRIDRQTIGVVGNMSFRDPNTQAMMPVGKGAIPFPDFAPRLLASLVASSTAACTSGVVTVTATAHAIPASVFEGFSFYFPGSPSLVAGWYSNFARTGVDTLTFSAPLSADFGSESVNAGAAFTSEATYESTVLPANTFDVGDRLTIPTFRSGNNQAGTKTIRIKIGANTVTTQANTSTTTIVGAAEFSCTFDSRNTAVGNGGFNSSLTSTLTRIAADIATDLTISLTGQLSAAGMYMSMIASKMRIE